MSYLEGAVYLVITQLLVFALLNLRSKSQSNRILGVFLLLIVDNIRKSFIPLYVDNQYFNIVAYNLHLDLLYGPMIFLYLSSKIKHLTRKEFIRHLTFPIAYNLAVLTFMIIYRFVLGLTIDGYINLLITETRILTFALYAYLIFQLIKRENWKILKYAKRYRAFILIFGSYCCLYYINIFLIKYGYEFIRESQPVYAYVTYVIFLTLTIFLVFYGATEINWLKSFFLNSNVHRPNERLSAFDQIESKIDHVFEAEKIHLDKELSLALMAEKLDVKTSELSDYLQQVGKTNFYDFVNTLRIREFKDKLSDPKYQHLDMLGIAFESGFQSKATFNRAFKKLEKLTPSEYKNMTVV